MVVSLGEGKRTEWMCQRRLSTVLIVHFDLKGEFFNYTYDAYVDIFFFSTKSWYIPRLETFANCDPSAPEYLGRICGIFFFPFSFIKNWEKHLWRMLLRPILLILEPSHCLSTASFGILSHSHGLAAEEEPGASLILPSSRHHVWRELLKCAVFSLYSKCPSVCVKMGKICLMAEGYYRHPL